MSELVDFVIADFMDTTMPAELLLVDAVSNITIFLNDMGLVYKTDWKFNYSGHRIDGKKVLVLEFFNASDAMLARLNGLTNGQ